MLFGSNGLLKYHLVSLSSFMWLIASHPMRPRTAIDDPQRFRSKGWVSVKSPSSR